MSSQTVPISQFQSDEDLGGHLRSMNIGMTPEEARKVNAILQRDPTRVELFIFDIEWSEHCSYKSSRPILKKYLPTDASNVILGPSEDAGIVQFTHANGHDYALVFAHESHNHPSQVLPVEGAATGIGGIVRDVDCMGADVFAVADGLRFGDPGGEHRSRTSWIVRGVVDGIWQYGNALGVPNLGGDLVFDGSYDDNCLVNVVCMGIVRTDRIIRSRVPKEANHADYDLILVGKPTDGSGFGGVTFASEILDDKDAEKSLGAVQIHDPFLKNILITRKANRMVTDLAAEKKIPIGMKDLGGGGLACAASEICSAGGFGATINLDHVHISMKDMPPEVITCSETQERFIFAVPPDFTPEVLRIYNELWQLPAEANGARASVIGHTTRDPRFLIRYRDEIVCDAPIEEITSGILYHRESTPMTFTGTEPEPGTVIDIKQALETLIASPNGCSRYPVYRHYDTEVQGSAVIRPGEADAGVMAPLLLAENSPAGAALSVDGNPYIGEIDPYWGGAHAVAEAMRNIISTGAAPRALTDCLNYGNPEKPEAFWQFEEGVRGIADAARKLWQIGTDHEPVPIISGNVSFYNESSQGRSIRPSPIVACAGVMDDYSLALTRHFKSTGSRIILVGERRALMGGSMLYREVLGVTGSTPPDIVWNQERADMHAVHEIISHRLALACHDISEGGMLMSLAEMCITHRNNRNPGVQITLPDSHMPPEHFLFCESGGFLLEISPENIPSALKILNHANAWYRELGSVTPKNQLTLKTQDETILDLNLTALQELWCRGLEEIIP